MNFGSPLLACSLNITGGQFALLLFLFAIWWAGCALAIVNPVFVYFLPASREFKIVHFTLCAFYVVPGLVMLLGSYDQIRISGLAGEILPLYTVAIPFITGPILFFFFGRVGNCVHQGRQSSQRRSGSCDVFGVVALSVRTIVRAHSADGVGDNTVTCGCTTAQ